MIEQLTITGGADPVGSSPDTDKRYTPAWLCSAVRDAQKVEQFTLDPCSDIIGNKNVQALRFYSFEEDGLDLCNFWHGSIWLNWPFSQPLPWMLKTQGEWSAGRIEQITVLARCDMSTRWAKEALAFFDLVCHPRDRICFEGCDSSPDFACVLFHKGGDLAHWAKVMKEEVGPVLKAV